MLLNRIAWVTSAFFLTACVTINIYFPAAAAEEAARTIVRDVLEGDQGQQPRQEQESQPEKKPQQEGKRSYRPNRALVMLGRFLEIAIPTAQAAGAANINIDTPAISRLRNSMHARQSGLGPFYRSGAVGFDQGGRVAIRDLGSVPLKDRNRLKKLVADENRDRDALYREIARANQHPEWEKDIRGTFARIWIDEAPSGYWYQQGGWKQK